MTSPVIAASASRVSQRGVDEDLAVEQIARRIPGHRQLRHHHDVRARLDPLGIRAPDQLRIRRKRADGGIDLSDVDLHPFAASAPTVGFN